METANKATSQTGLTGIRSSPAAQMIKRTSLRTAFVFNRSIPLAERIATLYEQRAEQIVERGSRQNEWEAEDRAFMLYVKAMSYARSGATIRRLIMKKVELLEYWAESMGSSAEVSLEDAKKANRTALNHSLIGPFSDLQDSSWRSFDEAVNDFRKAIRCLHGAADSYLVLGNRPKVRNLYKRAIDHCNKIIKHSISLRGSTTCSKEFIELKTVLEKRLHNAEELLAVKKN